MQSANDLKYEKIANMMAMGVSNTSIAEVMGITEGRVSQIKEEEGFKRVLAEKMQERLSQNAELNEGWDSVERKALEIIQNTLKFRKDGDYALRAAMVANRANRRGGQNAGNDVLPGKMGGRVVINLNTMFVGKLNNLQAPQQRQTLKDLITNTPQKRVDVLAPGQVKKLLVDEMENSPVINDIDLGDFKLG